jgi:cobalt transporter subunit CbtA
MAALLVGVLSGLVLTAIQHWQVIPIIETAERYEGGHNLGEQAAAHQHAGHDHSATDWAPADGIERSSYTLLANVLTAIGLALLVLAAIVTSLQAKAASGLDWRHGLVWGAAGYAAFFAAPSLGIPPNIPGTVVPILEHAQAWWVFAVVCTAGGFAGAAFLKSPWRWAALALVAVPHLVGAPQPPTAPFDGHTPSDVAELTRLTSQFIKATAVANAALWLTLGIASVWTVRRFISPHA